MVFCFSKAETTQTFEISDSLKAQHYLGSPYQVALVEEVAQLLARSSSHELTQRLSMILPMKLAESFAASVKLISGACKAGQSFQYLTILAAHDQAAPGQRSYVLACLKLISPKSFPAWQP